MARPLTTPSDRPAGTFAPDRLTATLAGAAQRVLDGEDFRYAVREFIDQFGLRPDDSSRAGAIAEPPRPTGDRRYDAYLGALAEHLALVHDLERPVWCVEPGRFLDRFWFVSDVPGFRAVSIAQGPGRLPPPRRLHPRALAAPGLMERAEILAALTDLAAELRRRGTGAARSRSWRSPRRPSATDSTRPLDSS